MELVRVDHPKVVNSAYFSPVTGKKLLTTCIDNRVRIWNYLLALDGPPDKEIVHSHDFNRYLTPFRAEWDPKDHDERLFVIGRLQPALTLPSQLLRVLYQDDVTWHAYSTHPKIALAAPRKLRVLHAEAQRRI